MSTDGVDWTKVPELPLCRNPTGLREARMSSCYTQEGYKGPCIRGGEILIYGRTCRCGVLNPEECQYLVLAEPLLTSSSPAVPTTQ